MFEYQRWLLSGANAKIFFQDLTIAGIFTSLTVFNLLPIYFIMKFSSTNYTIDDVEVLAVKENSQLLFMRKKLLYWSTLKAAKYDLYLHVQLTE